MQRLITIAMALVLVLAACGGDDDAVFTTDAPDSTDVAPADTEAPAATEAPAETTTTAATPERGATWFEVTGSAEVSAPNARVGLRLEEFSQTWLLVVTAILGDDEFHRLAFRFQDGFTPDPGSYDINFQAQPVVATYAPPDSGNSEFFDELQSGTFEITGNDGTTLTGTFAYEASVDDTGEQTVMVEGAFEVEIGDAFGPPPSE